MFYTVLWFLIMDQLKSSNSNKRSRSCLIVINKAFGGIIKKIKGVENITVTNIIENFRNSFEQLENNFNQRVKFLVIETD
jgi:hypothetical protein